MNSFGRYSFFSAKLAHMGREALALFFFALFIRYPFHVRLNLILDLRSFGLAMVYGGMGLQWSLNVEYEGEFLLRNLWCGKGGRKAHVYTTILTSFIHIHKSISGLSSLLSLFYYLTRYEPKVLNSPLHSSSCDLLFRTLSSQLL
jgi:hypothetical protein